MSRPNLAKTRGCSYHDRVFLCRYVTIEYFYVATEFWPRPEGFLSQQYIFRSRLTLAKTKGFMLRQSILCRDRVWPRLRDLMLR